MNQFSDECFRLVSEVAHVSPVVLTVADGRRNEIVEVNRSGELVHTDSVESISASASAPEIELAALFSDLVRLETELWDRVDDRLRRDHDLPLSWFEPMQLMNRVPGCRVADIAGALSITVGGTSKLIDRIEQAGWCSRSPNPDDARSSLLHLTGPGRRLLTGAQRSFEEELEASLGTALSPERLASLATTVSVARQRLADRQGSTR